MLGLTYANAVLCVPGSVQEVLERRQRDIGRQALGCYGMVANEAVQEDLGWSSFEAEKRPARSNTTAVSASWIAAGGPRDTSFTLI